MKLGFSEGEKEDGEAEEGGEIFKGERYLLP